MRKGAKLFKLFYKRNFKTVLTSALVFLTVLGLLGITIVATATPYTLALNEELARIDIDSYTTIGYQSLNNTEFTSINQTLESIKIEEAHTEYGIIANLNATINNQTIDLPVFGLTDSLFDFLGYPNRKIISSQDLAYNTINLSLPEDPNSAIYSLPINDYQNFSYDDNYDILERILYGRDMTPPLYDDFDQFLCVNITTINDIIMEFPRNSLAISAFIIVQFDDDYLRQLSINKIEQIIHEEKLSIFLDCLKGGFTSDFIHFYSYLQGAIITIKADIGYEITSIQILSLPNIIIVIIIIFSVDLGMYNLLKKKGKFLWTRGLSLKRTIFILIISEIITDLLMVVIAQLVFSIIILALNLPYFILKSLFISNMLVFTIISLSKFIRFSIKHKSILSVNKVESVFDEPVEHDEHQIKNRKITFTITITLIILLIVLFLQLYLIFEPLFWFPLIRGSMRLVMNIFSIIAIIIALLGYSFLSYNNKKKNEGIFNFETLFKKLFKNKLKMKITQQRIITFGLCILLTFLLFYYISDINYAKSRLESTEISWDVMLDNFSPGFNYSKIPDLPKSISEINLAFSCKYSSVSFVANNKTISSAIIAFNSSLLASYDVSWNYFIGNVGNNHTNEDVSQLSTKSIIINQKVAELSGLREGDTISIDLLLIPIVDDIDETSYQIDNVQIIGIVDTLPLGASYRSHLDKYIYADFSLFELVYSNLNGHFTVSELSLDLNIDPSLNKIEREEEIKAVAEKVRLFFNIEENFNIIILDDVNNYEVEPDTNAETYFIVFDAILLCLILPILIIVLNYSFLKEISPSLKRIVSRGYSSKKIIKDTSRSIMINHSSSILFGLLSGLAIAFIYIRYDFPSLLLATNYRLFMQLGLFILLFIIMNITTLAVTHFLTIKQLKKVIM
ncbi:MAG TPA: hypothetical protein VMZ29_13195 [Candidatus Bathyarchaeia archaeon]|nr:hypothetical protein [Candidatus Bathyarchaeia archaeon]